MKIILIAGLLFVTSNSWADYCRTSNVKATVCKGFVIESCSAVEVDAVEKDDKLYDVGQCFDDVSEYSKSSRTCTIINGDGIFPFSLLNKLPDFYSKNEKGKYNRIDNVEYITFSCKKT